MCTVHVHYFVLPWIHTTLMFLFQFPVAPIVLVICHATVDFLVYRHFLYKIPSPVLFYSWYSSSHQSSGNDHISYHHPRSHKPDLVKPVPTVLLWNDKAIRPSHSSTLTLAQHLYTPGHSCLLFSETTLMTFFFFLSLQSLSFTHISIQIYTSVLQGYLNKHTVSIYMTQTLCDLSLTKPEVDQA